MALLGAIYCLLMLTSCSKAYYGAMEKVGIHKRDILVERVEESRDAQAEAQAEFKSALEEFQSVVQLKESNLEKAYGKFKAEYEDCEDAAAEVSERIEAVEDVAQALFSEWRKELKLYQNQDMRRSSQRQLTETKNRYNQMLRSMHQAEQSMEPVLLTFRDNVLFLKHNLNAQAIGSLQAEFSQLERRIGGLIKEMNLAIASSDRFIAELKR
ncbi:MAG: DUF2959 domain-containing protein [Thermodesulfobacteriota bacterium]